MAGQDYDIIPADVGRVLAQVDTDGDQLITHYEQLADPLQGAGQGCGGSALITSALGDVVAWLQNTLGTARTQMQHCLEGATNATNAYIFGDQEMAHEYGETTGQTGQPTAVFPATPTRARRNNDPRDTPNQRASRRPK